MLHHVEIYVSRIDVSHAFWSAILAKIGWEPAGRWADGFSLSAGDGAYLTFVQVAEKHRSSGFNRARIGLNHLAFKVRTRTEVDALRRYCQENGIPSLYDDRYPFANGGTDYYALFVEDPDRIKVEFVASE